MALRHFGLILFIFVTGTSSALPAAAQDSSQADSSALLPYQRKKGLARYKALWEGRIKSRKIAIHPSTPAVGINSGLVIAYGHVIRPPFQIEWRDGKLMVNDVQVNPSLVLQREEVPRVITPEMQRASDRRDSVEKAAQNLYADEIHKKPLNEVQKDVSALIVNSGVFENPRWTSKSSVNSNDKGTSIQNIWVFSDTRPIALSQEDIHRIENVQSQKAQQTHLSALKRSLEKGGALVFDSEGGQGDGQDWREQVNRIMAEKDLTEEQRVEKLKAKVFEGDYGMALDVVDNYDSAEWKVK